jgi:hypothetical protein
MGRQPIGVGGVIPTGDAMTTPNPIALVRARLSCQLEAAAREVEQCLTTDTTIRAAYDQGRADERERIVSLLSCWRDAIPSGRLYASTRRTLESITDSITS